MFTFVYPIDVQVIPQKPQRRKYNRGQNWDQNRRSGAQKRSWTGKLSIAGTGSDSDVKCWEMTTMCNMFGLEAQPPSLMVCPAGSHSQRQQRRICVAVFVKRPVWKPLGTQRNQRPKQSIWYRGTYIQTDTHTDPCIELHYAQQITKRQLTNQINYD